MNILNFPSEILCIILHDCAAATVCKAFAACSRTLADEIMRVGVVTLFGQCREYMSTYKLGDIFGGTLIVEDDQTVIVTYGPPIAHKMPVASWSYASIYSSFTGTTLYCYTRLISVEAGGGEYFVERFDPRYCLCTIAHFTKIGTMHDSALAAPLMTTTICADKFSMMVMYSGAQLQDDSVIDCHVDDITDDKHLDITTMTAAIRPVIKDILRFACGLTITLDCMDELVRVYPAILMGKCVIPEDPPGV